MRRRLHRDPGPPAKLQFQVQNLPWKCRSVRKLQKTKRHVFFSLSGVLGYQLGISFWLIVKRLWRDDLAVKKINRSSSSISSPCNWSCWGNGKKTRGTQETLRFSLAFDYDWLLNPLLRNGRIPKHSRFSNDPCNRFDAPCALRFSCRIHGVAAKRAFQSFVASAFRHHESCCLDAPKHCKWQNIGTSVSFCFGVPGWLGGTCGNSISETWSGFHSIAISLGMSWMNRDQLQALGDYACLLPGGKASFHWKQTFHLNGQTSQYHVDKAVFCVSTISFHWEWPHCCRLGYSCSLPIVTSFGVMHFCSGTPKEGMSYFLLRWWFRCSRLWDCI